MNETDRRGPVGRIKEPPEGRLPGPTEYETVYRKRGTIKSANHRAKQARKINRGVYSGR